MDLALFQQVLPLWGRRREAPVGGAVGRLTTPPSVGRADTFTRGEGLS